MSKVVLSFGGEINSLPSQEGAGWEYPVTTALLVERLDLDIAIYNGSSGYAEVLTMLTFGAAPVVWTGYQAQPVYTAMAEPSGYYGHAFGKVAVGDNFNLGPNNVHGGGGDFMHTLLRCIDKTHGPVGTARHVAVTYTTPMLIPAGWSVCLWGNNYGNAVDVEYQGVLQANA